MQGNTGHKTLGTVLDACHEQALRKWRDEYAGNIALGDLFGNHVRAVRIASNSLGEGHLDVMVKVVGRNRYATEVYFWKLYKVAGIFHAM